VCAHDPNVDEPAPPHPSELAASIADADRGRGTPPPPLPKGWAGLVERDRRARQHSHPNAAGGPIELLLYPWRLYILVAAAVLIPILIVISFIT
jgi:hypothetical protein